MTEQNHASAKAELQELNDQLLRSEQQYFNQLNQQALQLEESIQVIKDLEEERSKWQAIFNEAQAKQLSLEAERQQWQKILQDAHDKQQALEGDLQQTNTLLSTERLQWQEIFTEAQQKQKELESDLCKINNQLSDERDQWRKVFEQAQQEQKQLAASLADQKDLLFQARKRIAADSNIIKSRSESLAEIQHQQLKFQSSLKMQLKLLWITLRSRLRFS